MVFDFLIHLKCQVFNFILFDLLGQSIFDIPNLVLAKDPGAKLNNASKSTSRFLSHFVVY